METWGPEKNEGAHHTRDKKGWQFISITVPLVGLSEPADIQAIFID